jgi:RNA polymerase sigma-70 factor (ECF subfamily)
MALVAATADDTIESPAWVSSIPTADLVTAQKAGDDGALVDRIARGDPAALGELYDRHGRVVFGVLYRLLGAAEPAEEVAQDAFHAVWRRAATYRPDRGSVRTWLLAIARNAAIDWRRTKGKRIEREATIDEAAELVEETRVEDRVIASLQAERVRAAVASLPDEQRVVLSLAFWSGLSQTEIAERTGTPLGTVKSRVRLGMSKLRDHLRLESEGA